MTREAACDEPVCPDCRTQMHWRCCPWCLGNGSEGGVLDADLGGTDEIAACMPCDGDGGYWACPQCDGGQV